MSARPELITIEGVTKRYLTSSGPVEALHHVFSGPEALPTLAEIEKPSAWIERAWRAAGGRARPDSAGDAQRASA